MKYLILRVYGSNFSLVAKIAFFVWDFFLLTFALPETECVSSPTSSICQVVTSVKMPEATTRETRVARETAQNPSDEGSDFHLLQGEKSTFDSFKSYGHSHLVTELIFSISVLVIDMMFRAIHPDPRQRNLPYQLLESGEYVVNQVFNEEFLGETVSNRALYVYGAILPFLLQL